MSRGHSGSGQLPSGFQTELQRFRGLVNRWASHQLNRFFDLSIEGARRRGARTSILLLALVVAAVVVHVLLRIDSGLMSGNQAEPSALAALAFFSSLRIILVLGIASSIALNMAGYYLADVFELPDIGIAWQFIGDLASGMGNNVLHLSEGRIIEADKNSPVVLIGGPGRVQVEFDTAALFERPDGTPHVVGTTHGNPGTMLQGFERLREPVINLRDQYIGSPSGEPMTILGRSLDGMPVSVTDVRGVFSVRRRAEAEVPGTTIEQPFPFRPRDIEDLIYKQEVPVLAAGEHASGQPADWTKVMQDLIRGSLSEFMSQNRLSEYLAGIGTQEVELSEFRDDTILTRTLQISQELKAPGTSNTPPKTSFHPRTELSGKFKKYSGEFSLKAQEHGLELQWIGVGTWKMPDENSGATVNDRHLEAWRINRENAQRSDPQALERVAEGAALDGKLGLIQDTPIASHQRDQARYSDKDVLVECLLQGYWEQLGNALDVLYKAGAESPELEGLEQAVLRVEELLRIRQVGHILGGGTMSRVRPRPARAADRDAPPAPGSQAEAASYRALLGKLEGNYRVAEAMIANEARRHSTLSREDLIKRIVQRFERHGR